MRIVYSEQKTVNSMEIATLFHNVRSTYNVGALFRTADGAGVSKIYLTGYTPTPIDRFGRIQKDIAKTALGAQASVRWESARDPTLVVDKLRAKGWAIVGVEQDASAISYRRFNPSQPTLFLFGNEVRGLSKTLRSRCDTLIEIPMHGMKESLNVSVAAGIILFSAAGHFQ